MVMPIREENLAGILAFVALALIFSQSYWNRILGFVVVFTLCIIAFVYYFRKN